MSFFNHELCNLTDSRQAWLGIPSGIPENSGEFPIPDPFSTQFFPIPILVPNGKGVPPTFVPFLLAN